MKTVDNNSSKKTDLEGEKRKREDGKSMHKRNVKAKQNHGTQDKQEDKKLSTLDKEQIVATLELTSKNIGNEEENLTREEIMLGKSLRATLSAGDGTQMSKQMSHLQKSNALGDDRNLADYGGNRKYWYSIGDGFRLLIATRHKLDYIDATSGNFFSIKAPGEDHSATRENNEHIFIADPYYIGNFADSLSDDIKTITGTHIVDAHGDDQTAKNNQWSAMPTLLVIPLLSGMHWQAIRVQIDYVAGTASILYSDPYGENGFSNALVASIRESLLPAINDLIRAHGGAAIPEGSITSYKKIIDQQGRGVNGFDCGPITFSNIVDYMYVGATNEQFADGTRPHTVSAAADIGHEDIMVDLRARDVETYNIISGIALPGSSTERIENIKKLLKESAEAKRVQLQSAAYKDIAYKEIASKISSLPDGVCSFIFEIIDSERAQKKLDLKEGYSIKELDKAYNLVTGEWLIIQSANSDLRTTGVAIVDIPDKLRPGGLKNTEHGNLYQWSLLTWVTLQADPTRKFQLITEAEEFEKFDDLVLKYDDEILFLQAKHSSKEAGKDDYKKSDFTSNDYKGEASLAKYFDSWYRLEKGEHRKKKYYVFFTNRGIIDYACFLEPSSKTIPQLEFKEGATFEFKGGDVRKDFIDAIRANSEEVRSHKDKSELDIKAPEIQDAQKYLKKKFKKYESTQKIEVSGRGKHQLTKEQQYTIKLAQQEDEVFSSISDNNLLKAWLRAKDSEGNFKITFTKEISSKKYKSVKELENIRLYLESKFNEYKVCKEGTLEVDGSAQISKKAQAVIKLAQQEDEVFSLISNDDSLKAWLREKNVNGDYRVVVKVVNPREILSDIFEKEINKFLDQLILKVNQPNFVQMSNKIYAEMSDVTPIAAAEFCANIELRVLRWFADPGDCDLSSEEIKKMIKSARGDALRFYLLADNANSHALKGSALPKIEEFLESTNNIIHIQKSPGIELRIAQTIKERGIAPDNYAFFDIASPYLDYVSTILHGEQMRIVVFDFSSYEPDDLKILKELLAVAIHNKKKVILLSKDDDENFVEYGSHTYIDNELSDEQIEKAVKGKEDSIVNIAGKNYALGTFLADKASGVYQAMKHPNFLYEILNQLDQDNLDSGLLHDIYIENELLKGKAIYNWRNILSTVRTNLFVIKGAVRASEIREALIGEKDNSQKRLVSSLDEEITKETKYRLISKKDLLDGFIDKPHIRQICIDDTLAPEEIQYDNYVILSIVEDGKAIIENVRAVALPIAESYRFEKENIIGREDIIEKNFCVFSANAGYGKSSFCLHQRAIWLKGKDNKFLWVVKLDLSRLDFKGEKANIFELFNKKTSGLDWSDWQLEALMHDMRHPGKVKILLDGFDEIKDSTVIKKLGDWIVSIPKEVNLIITTRPYAAHNIPMPDNRNLDLFLTLQEYDSKDKEKYIRDYISAVIKDAAPQHIEDVIKKYQKLSMSSSDSVRSLLGVPLEMYLFCEAFEFEILEDYRALKEGGEILQRIEGVELGTVGLFEKFLVKKLSIFLSKHLKIENHLHSSRGEHLTYVTTSLYADILQVFAFKQAFDLDYEIVNNALRERYYDEYVMQELKETGLVLVEKKGTEYVLKFNHATYQEYFAALKIISGLCSNNGDVQQIFRQYKHYMPHYQVIFGFAGQLSLGESKFLLRIDQDQFLRIQKFWGALYGEISDSHDLLGEAESLLVGRCLSVLSSEDIEILERSTFDKSWHKKLTRLSKDPNLDRRARKEAQAAPVERTQAEEEHKEHDIEEQIKKYCDDKNRLKELRDYVSSFGKVTQSKVRGLLSRELESRKEWDYEGSYWALDFGISAVALCGEHFSRNLADKLKNRADMWSNNFNLALGVWDEIVGTAWREHSKEVADSVSYALSQFLQSKNARSFFAEEIPNLRQVVGAFMQYTRNNFDYATSIIEILQVAKRVSYAVVVSSDNVMLELIGGDRYPISVNHRGFGEALEVLKSTQCDDPITYISLVQANHKFSELLRRYEFESELSDLNPQEMEKYFKGRFDEFSEHKKLGELESFFSLLEELKPEHLDFAKRIFATNFFAAKHKANAFWEYDFGAKALKYCGHYVTSSMKALCEARVYKSDVVTFVQESCTSLFKEFVGELEIVQDLSGLKEIRIALSKIVKILSGDESAQELIINIKAKIEYLKNIELHIKNSRTLHQAKVLLECGIMPPNADDMKLDVSGEGSYSVKSYLFGNAFEAYFLSGLEKLLKLRLLDLNNLDLDFLVIQPTETSNEIVISQNVLTFLENSELDKIVLLPLLTPADPIGRMKHWVGVIIEKKLRDITIKYLDSENQVIDLVVPNQLELKKLGFSIVMDQIYVEQQRYRNCGSELIENFIYYMTGSRSTQEAAVYVHSLLLENTLLDPVEYALKILENSKLIRFLSNQVPLMVDRPITDSNRLLAIFMQQVEARFEVLTLSEETYLSKLLSPYTHLSTQQTITMFGDSVLLVVDKEVSFSQAQVALLAQNIGAILPIQSGDFSVVSSTALVGVASSGSPEQQFQGQGSGFFTFIHRVIGAVTNTLNNGLMNMGNAIIDVIMQNNYIKHQLINYVYHDELLAINGLITKPYIQSSEIPAVQLLLQKHPSEWNKNDFKKIKLVVHPDKGGNDEDFRTINAFQEQLGNKEQMCQNLLSKVLPDIQIVIHKTTIGFKSFDTTVDAARLIYEPTLQNTNKAVLDCAYLYSMYQGINGVSAVISGSEAI